MIAIIDGCGANIASVQCAFERLGKKSVLTTDINIIRSATHVILPGVGTAQHAMEQLKKYQLIEVILQLQQPVLGICLGMQLLYEYSDEGGVSCLGVIPSKIECIPKKMGLTIPHIGWNKLQFNRESPLLNGIKRKSYVYFIHSYAAPLTDDTIAFSQHGIEFSAIVKNKNFYGMQFHPEKSGKIGETLLNNFLSLR